jgi:hypothetical protein
VFSDKLILDRGRDQPVTARCGKSIRAADSDGDSLDVRVIAVEGRTALVEYKKLPKEVVVPDNAVLVTDAAGQPIVDAHVHFVHPTHKTHLSEKTDPDGVAKFVGGDQTPVTVFCAHPSYRAFRKARHIPGDSLHVELVSDRQIGSMICDGTGHVPGLDGRLNPILDHLNRRYMYADNIALEGGKQQPIEFRLGKAISAVDSKGHRFQLVVVEIIGRTSLIEFVAQ